MKLVFLGTSGSQPTEKRGLSCICLEREVKIYDRPLGLKSYYNEIVLS